MNILTSLLLSSIFLTVSFLLFGFSVYTLLFSFVLIIVHIFFQAKFEHIVLGNRVKKAGLLNVDFYENLEGNLVKVPEYKVIAEGLSIPMKLYFNSSMQNLKPHVGTKITDVGILLDTKPSSFRNHKSFYLWENVVNYSFNNYIIDKEKNYFIFEISNGKTCEVFLKLKYKEEVEKVLIEKGIKKQE